MTTIKSNKKVKRKYKRPGEKVLDGRYEITKVLHTSGMANVYIAKDVSLGKLWCLKEAIKSFDGVENRKAAVEEYKGLIREANIMKELNHSGIPRITTIEDEGDSTFIVMDYIDGISIKTWLVQKGVVNQDVVVKWLIQLCGILAYLHNRRHPIVYLDLKPDNIMVQFDGNIKLLDFGISQVITSENRRIIKPLGTNGFASPEQRRVGHPYDLRSDVYAFGMTMYYMLTGLNPSIIDKGDLKPIREVNSSLSVGLEMIVNKCTKNNPDERYQTMEELMYDLRNYEKLDSNYKSKLNRKLKITFGLLGFSIVMFGLSFIPLMLNNTEENNKYISSIELAEKTGRTDDYVEAISMRPSDLTPYSGLIDSIKADGVFTKDEEGDLLGLINPNMKSIKESDGYGELAYNIGKLYWFYYEGEDGDTVSSKWFKEAYDLGYNKDESKIYYDLGNFKRNISMAVAESSDAGMYKEYWDNLVSAKGMDGGEIIELQLYNSIADAINIYSYRLMTDGVSKDEMMTQYNDIGKYLEVSKPMSDKSKELYNNLNTTYSKLLDKINTTYEKGGN